MISIENLNILEILKIGLPGLVFLLSILSYRLLSKEEEKEHPHIGVLHLIRNFMYINVILAVLTLIPPIIDYYFVPKTQTFTIEAITNHLEQGKASVCQGASYAGRNLLIKDNNTKKLIQVVASSFIPCLKNAQIVLSPTDTSSLGLDWSPGTVSSEVEVVTAPPGYKFDYK